MTAHPDMTVLGPRAWTVLHRWAEEFKAEVGDSCGCGEFAVKAASALHDLVNVKLGKPLYAPANFRAFRDVWREMGPVDSTWHQRSPAELSLVELLQESDVLMGRSTAPPKEQLGLDLFPAAPAAIPPIPDLPEVLTRDPGVLIFQVTLPGPEAEDLVLKPQFPAEEKMREERVDPRLQPTLLQGVKPDAAMGSLWPDPTYDPLEEDDDEEDTEGKDGPTIRHRVKTGPRKTGGSAMPKDRRPPKAWWESCIGGVEGDDKAAVCGRIWTRIRPSVKARIRREGEVFQAAQETEAGDSDSFIDFIIARVRQGNEGPAIMLAGNEPLRVIDDREEKCKAKGGAWKDGRCVSMPITGVINPEFVEGDAARMDLGTNLQELADILSHPERMGEVDGITQRIVREVP